MAGIGKIEVEYRDGNGKTHTFRKYYATVFDAGVFLAGDGSTIDLSASGAGSPGNNAGGLIQAFLKSYEFVASTGSVILGASADFRADGGPGIVDAVASYTISNFTPAGSSPGFGPFPNGFVSFKGKSAISNRPVWLRFYSSGGALWNKPTQFAPSSLDADWPGWLQYIATPGADLQPCHWSGVDTVEGDWVAQTSYNITIARHGDRNG